MLTVHCQAHIANAYLLVKSKFCFPDGSRASQVVHGKRRSNRCSVWSFWSEQGTAVYGRRQPNCRVHRTTKTAAFLFLVEANLCFEARVKLLPHCITSAAHQKQREANLCFEASVKLLPHCKRIAAHQKQFEGVIWFCCQKPLCIGASVKLLQLWHKSRT